MKDEPYEPVPIWELLNNLSRRWGVPYGAEDQITQYVQTLEARVEELTAPKKSRPDNEAALELHVIFGQSKESYPGEHAPEALDVADEFTMEENPEWLEGRLQEHQKNTSLEAVAVVRVTVPLRPILQALRPRTRPAIPAVIRE